MTTPPWIQQLRDEVKWRMKAFGITQVALAEYTDISESYMSQILNGYNTGSAELLEKIAIAMGVRIVIQAAGPPDPGIMLSLDASDRYRGTRVGA